MIKLAVYIELKSEKSKDLTHIEDGNPGIGGTEYCFAVLIDNLLSSYGEEFSLTLFTTAKVTFKKECNITIVKDVNEMLNLVSCNSYDILLMRTIHDYHFYQTLHSHNKIKIVFWSHNYFNAHIAKCISNAKQVIANVFVGKQMYDFYYDHDIILKSTYIYNPVIDTIGITKRIYEPFSVVYMGNITREKGIIELLKIWDIVIRSYPQATLKIIGKGSLYSSDTKLGRLGIADEKLEEYIKPYLYKTSRGDITRNIQFMGIMGKEKYEVFKKCAVGIVNPSARTETFGLGIIEMATAKLPVVTRCWNGHLDTITNKKTGLMAFTIKGMARCIMKLFEDEKLNKQLGENAKEKTLTYAPAKITKKWHDLFYGIATGKICLEKIPASKPYWNNYKLFRLINAFVRFKLGFRFVPSIVQIETFANDIIKNIKSK